MMMQGFDLTFSGFSQKLSLLVEKVVRSLGKFQVTQEYIRRHIHRSCIVFVSAA